MSDMHETTKTTYVETGEATALLPIEGRRPLTVIGTPAIRDTFDGLCLKQARNMASAPGVTKAVLNPDGHCGYGAPIGSVLVSPTHIYPGPVGVDIKCSMSLLQLDIPDAEITDPRLRRALIDAICERIPTGAGKGFRSVKKGRRVADSILARIPVEGATPELLEAVGVPSHWAARCEDASHVGHDGTRDALAARYAETMRGHEGERAFAKLKQVGSLGGGNHFAEAEVVRVGDDARARSVAERFGLRDGHVAFLSHCGSRGLGHLLAQRQFRALREHFEAWGTPFPANDHHLVYAPLGTPEADDYLDDMAMGANFASVNHMVINALVLEAFREVMPGANGELVYFISHNIARREVVDGVPQWVHRKGATRAFPAGHHELAATPFVDTGHPILLPGDPVRGSAVMVADPGAALTAYSINHGAGRVMGRKSAMRNLDQRAIDESLRGLDIMTNCRAYPRDEAPAVYKPFDEVLRSVSQAGLASEVARLQARFVIKDGAPADD